MRFSRVAARVAAKRYSPRKADELKALNNTFYVWDDVGGELEERQFSLPSNITPEQAMDFADKAMEQALIDDAGEGYNPEMDDYGLHNQQTEIRNGVYVMTGNFGRGAEARIYWHPTDPKEALALAGKEVGSGSRSSN